MAGELNGLGDWFTLQNVDDITFDNGETEEEKEVILSSVLEILAMRKQSELWREQYADKWD